MTGTNLVQITKHFTSRTAILTTKVCPYKRYLAFELAGTGYSTERVSLDLLIGTVCHRGLQHLLEHCRLHTPDEELSEACIDEAVAKAYEVWRDTLSKHQLWLHSGEEDRLEWIVAEQETLFEGLIRAFAIRRLPTLLEEYEILEVEHEEVFKDFTEPKVCDLCNGNKTINKEQAVKFFEEPFENLKEIGFTKDKDIFE